MMDDDDLKDSRRASAQSFFQSLDELFDYIETANTEAAQLLSPPPQAKSANPINSAIGSIFKMDSSRSHSDHRNLVFNYY